MLTRLALSLFFVISFQFLAGQDTIDLYPEHKGSLVYWSESRTTPRPLKIHHLRVSMEDPELTLFTLPGQDPDGPGPAESTLTLPVDLFSGHGALAAVNANAFAGLAGTENDLRGWYKNRPVNVQGMVVSDGKVISPVQDGRTAFWIDSGNRPHIGNPAAGDSVWQAVSDWSGLLLSGGLIIPDPLITIRHPRTAIGFEHTGKWLLITVADGRQPGYSEGVSLFELAQIMKAQGCTESVNLDGGGSSIMLIRTPDEKIATINRPSGILHRPVPVMLGIRKKVQQ